MTNKKENSSENGKRKAKATMMFSLGEKRMERFKRKAESVECSYSSVIQKLIDEWLEKK